jgi:hypothetical protein
LVTDDGAASLATAASRNVGSPSGSSLRLRLSRRGARAVLGTFTMSNRVRCRGRS